MFNTHLVDYIENSLKKNQDILALADYKGEGFTYSEVALQILKFHMIFETAGIRQGDKIALLGKNSARWCIVYLSVITYGAVIVPILPDFKPDDLHYVINHSDSVLLFCADNLYQELDIQKIPRVRTVISLGDFGLLHAAEGAESDTMKQKDLLFDPKYAADVAGGNYSFPRLAPAHLAVISYTSGTTGLSKGVMLSHNSLAANIWYAQKNMPLNPGDSIVSFLPLAHAYGCAFEFLFPFSIGCQIIILTKTPSPQVVIQAFREIKPSLVLSVPLVIEKIFKKQVLPKISKWYMKLLLQMPGIRSVILGKVHAKLKKAFGGNFREIIIGGAAFNAETETFFREIKFPYTVGYGMTECGPLISYAAWTVNKFGSSGKAVDTLEVKIDSPDPREIVGEIMVRGHNVMLGYYKNEEATREVLDPDGWLHTGDLGLIDGDGFIFIKGRSKNMLLGANGLNIYPEELEARLNNKYAVGESVIVQRGDKLIALIFPDADVVISGKISNEELKELYGQYLKEINAVVPVYMNIAKFEIHPEEFVKTPKRSIKRFLYT